MQTGKITALYARFSFDDGIDTESESIEHQKALLNAALHNYSISFSISSIVGRLLLKFSGSCFVICSCHSATPIGF